LDAADLSSHRDDVVITGSVSAAEPASRELIPDKKVPPTVAAKPKQPSRHGDTGE